MRLASLALSLILAGCAPAKPPLPLAEDVDLERFMGDWYVISNIPTFIEKGDHNAVESYRLNPDGSIATTFIFRADGFQGPLKRYEPTGYVIDQNSNAVWSMQFIWPIKADYRITFLKPDYSQTIIGREARDYVWVMARTPQIPEADYKALLEFLEENGYDVNKLQKVPQRWPSNSQLITREPN
jgi:apolipoprotein D and lipocalin family protein